MNDNKLIAEFMGLKSCNGVVRTNQGKYYDYRVPKGLSIIKEVETTIESEYCTILEEQEYCFIEDLKYHTSWDWLMPVVEKINMLDLEDNTHRLNVLEALQSLNKTTVHKIVIEFIKWYNEQRTTK